MWAILLPNKLILSRVVFRIKASLTALVPSSPMLANEIEPMLYVINMPFVAMLKLTLVSISGLFRPMTSMRPILPQLHPASQPSLSYRPFFSGSSKLPETNAHSRSLQCNALCEPDQSPVVRFLYFFSFIYY